LEVVVDEVGQPVMGSDGQPLMRPSGEGSTELGDLIQEDVGIEYLPGGVKRSVTKRKTLKGASERQQESANKESLIAQREAQIAAAQERLRIQEELGAARNAIEQLKAEAAAAKVEAALDDPKWRTVSSGEKNGMLVINQVNAAGELRSLETGQKARSNNAFFGPVNMGQGAVQGQAAGQDNVTDILAGKYGATPGATQAAVAAVSEPAKDNPLKLAGKDLDAYNWAISNPNDARAAQILKRLGGQ
jgi:hypothetical protein